MKEDSEKEKKNLLEWIVFGISAILVVSVIGYLAYKTYSYQSSPPDILVTYSPSPTKAAPYRYHVSIENKGGETAEEVIIELTLEDKGKVIERSEVNVPFVPQLSKRESWVIFSKDPALIDTVTSRVVSFRKP